MKNRIAGLALAAALAAPTLVSAQKIEHLAPWEVGDKAVWKWTLGGKTQQIEETFTQTSEAGITGVQKISGKDFTVAVALPSYSLSQGICLSNGQQCTFSPGIQMLQLPVEKGRRWTTSFTVTGDTFSSNVVQERQIEKVEKIRVPAGEFEAYRIAVRGRITGVDPKGNPYSGKEEVTEWWTFLAGKPKALKMDYRNSFGEKASIELVSLSVK